MIKDLLFLFIGLGLYSLFFYLFTKENKSLFFIFCATLIIFHDFIFINLSYHTDEKIVFILKAWQEFLFIFLILHLIIKKGYINKKIFVVFLLLLFISAYGILISIFNGFGLKDTILGWRMYLLPIIIPCLVYLNNGFKNIGVDFLYKYIQFLLLILVVYGLFQSLIFTHYNGDKIIFNSDSFIDEGSFALSNTLWFYDFFGSDFILPSWFNLVRNGEIRATSFFVSPIIFAQFLGVIGSLILAKFLYSKKKLHYGVLVGIALYGIYLTKVRAGLIFFMLTFIIIFLKKKIKFNNYLILGVPILLVIITFVALLMFKVGDASTVGRLTQYSDLLANFKMSGFGLGSDKAIIIYDSLVISVFFGLGIIAIIYLKIHLILLEEIKSFNFIDSRDKSFLGIGLIGCFSAYVYIIFFHFSLGSAPIRFIYFLTFYYLFQKYEQK